MTWETGDTLEFKGDIAINLFETPVNDSYQAANASVSLTVDKALFEVTNIDVVIDTP